MFRHIHEPVCAETRTTCNDLGTWKNLDRWSEDVAADQSCLPRLSLTPTSPFPLPLHEQWSQRPIM